MRGRQPQNGASPRPEKGRDLPTVTQRRPGGPALGKARPGLRGAPVAAAAARGPSKRVCEAGATDGRGSAAPLSLFLEERGPRGPRRRPQDAVPRLAGY